MFKLLKNKKGFFDALVGGLGFLGDWFFQEDAQSHADHSREETQEFQANERDTMYQDMVVDLEKAGLNPMLATAKQGAVTAGSSATAGKGTKSSIASDIAQNKVASAKASLDNEKIKTEKKMQEKLVADKLWAETNAKNMIPMTDFLNSPSGKKWMKAKYITETIGNVFRSSASANFGAHIGSPRIFNGEKRKTKNLR